MKKKVMRTRKNLTGSFVVQSRYRVLRDGTELFNQMNGNLYATEALAQEAIDNMEKQ